MQWRKRGRGAAQQNVEGEGHYVTRMEYSAYRLMTRPDQINPVLWSARLGEEYICTQYAAMTQDRLNYIATHQREIRAELYQVTPLSIDCQFASQLRRL